MFLWIKRKPDYIHHNNSNCLNTNRLKALCLRKLKAFKNL